MTSDVRSQDLSPPQIAALRVLAATGSSDEAASAGRVTVRTLRRWRSLDGFQVAYREAARRSASEATSDLLSAQSEAVQTLRACLRSGSPATRTRAARAILEIGQRTLEVDLDTRLGELEREVNKWQHDEHSGRAVWSA